MVSSTEESPRKKMKQCLKRRMSASCVRLLDQRRLVRLYPRIEHLPEMRDDGLVDVSSVGVDLGGVKVIRRLAYDWIFDKEIFDAAHIP